MHVDLLFRDAQPVDLPELSWTGGPAHCNALAQTLADSCQGGVEFLVAEVNGLRLIAHGVVDFRPIAGVGLLRLLIVDAAWRGLGVGRALIEELEARAVARGLTETQLMVELDNPAAEAVYEHLGYRQAGTAVDSWPTDGGGIVRVPVRVLSRRHFHPAR